MVESLKTEITLRLGNDASALLERLDRLAQAWLAGAVVAEGDAEGSGSVTEDAGDGGKWCPSADEFGRERVAEGVGVEPRLAESPRPPEEQPADVAGSDLRERNLLRDGSGLGAQWDYARAALAAHSQDLRAQIDVLRAEASELRAAKTRAEHKLEQISILLAELGDYGWLSWALSRRADNGAAVCRDHAEVAFRITHALQKIQSLLPPEHARPMSTHSREDEAAERDVACPSSAHRDSEHPGEVA